MLPTPGRRHRDVGARRAASGHRGRRRRRFAWPVYAGYAVALLAVGLLRLLVLGSQQTGGPAAVSIMDNPLYDLPAAQRIGSALYVLGRYVALLAFPLRLSADYSYSQIPPLVSLLDARVLAALAGGSRGRLAPAAVLRAPSRVSRGSGAPPGAAPAGLQLDRSHRDDPRRAPPLSPDPGFRADPGAGLRAGGALATTRARLGGARGSCSCSTACEPWIATGTGETTPPSLLRLSMWSRAAPGCISTMVGT